MPSLREITPLQRLALSAILLGSLVLAAHGPSLRSGFIVDDFPLLVQNPLVTEPGHWGEILTTDYFRSPDKAILYRPAVIGSFALSHALWGLDPLPHHALNLWLHALNTLLVGLVLWRLTGRGLLSLLAAGVFAIHPLSSEAVGCVFARTELLAALGQLVALLCWLWGRGSRLWPLWALGMAVALAVGLLSKESAVCFPGLILAEGVVMRRGWRSALLWTTLAGAVVVCYLLLRLSLFGVVAANPQRPELLALINPAAVLSWPHRTLVGLSLVPFALSKFVFPLVLSLDYSYDQIPTAFSLGLLLRGALGLLLIAATVREALRSPSERGWVALPIRLGASWFLTTWILVSNIVWPVSTVFADRLVYFPSIGLCLIAGWALSALWDLQAARGRSAWAVLVVALVAAGLISRSSVRQGDLTSHRAAALATARSSPRSAKALADAGGILIGEGLTGHDLTAVREGMELTERSVEIYPELAWVWLNLGKARLTLRDWAGAQAALREALRRADPGSRIANEAAELLGRIGDTGSGQQ